MASTNMWDDYEYQRSRATRFSNQAQSNQRALEEAQNKAAVYERRFDEKLLEDRLAGGTSRELSQRLAEKSKEAFDSKQALAESRALVAEWQAAMEAWRDLAQTLRDEIKACPNHEAHRFGKDIKAVKSRIAKVEDEARVERGLKPRIREST